MRKRVRLKQLTLGVAAALLAGSWQVPVWAAEEGPIKEDTTLTADTEVKADKNTFKGNISNGVAAVYANGSLDLNMAGHNLDLDVRNLKTKDNRGSGLQIRSGSTLMVHSDKQNSNAPLRLITINAHGNWSNADQHGGATSGIRFDEYAGKPMKAVINANVRINELWSGREPARGIWALGKATLEINGEFSIKQGAAYHYWTEANLGNKKEPGTFGIHVMGDSNKLNIKSVDIDDTRIQRGIQFGDQWNNAQNSVLRIGGGKLKIADDKARDQWLMWVKGSGKTYFNVNEAGTDAADQKTELAGPIHTENGGEVYLGLHGADSKWLGGTEAGAKGKTTLFLKNGATWDTMNGGRGTQLARLSSTNGNEGNIFQNDAGKLTIDDYAGRQKIYYSHTGGDGTDTSHYTAGDTHIKKAAANSFVTMVTDRTNPAANEEQIHKTLNALAGKLYYDAAKSGEDHLTGRAMLAEDLTASSAEVKVERMKFSSTTGQGSTDGTPAASLPPVTPPGTTPGQPSTPPAPAVLDTTQQIAEVGFDSMDLSEKWKNDGYGDDNGHYTFDKDVIIRTKASDNKVIPAQRYYTGGIVVDEEAPEGPVTVDMKAHRLTLNSTADSDERYASGIVATAGNLEIKRAGGIDINITGSKRSEHGIYAMATSHRNGRIVIENDDTAPHAVKIRNTSSGEKGNAITAKGASSRSALVDIKGLVDIEQDKENLLYASNDGEIRIGGGRMIAGVNAKAVHITRNGKVFINARSSGDGIDAASTERDVKIEGNVLLEGKDGVFGAALNTEQSYIKGKIGSSGSGSTRLLLANGARWDNQSVGIGGDTIGRSRLTYLKSDGGAIHQNDTQDLTIDKFEGKAKLFYKHESDGTDTAHYKAGDTHIKSAAENAEITVATDADRVNLSDDAAVHKTLNALAGKLYYDAAATERHLKGKAMIAEGLTASSASKKLEDITFKTNGQGSVKEDIGEGRQIVEGDWKGAVREQKYWDKKGVRSGSTYSFSNDAAFSPKLSDNPVKALNEYSRYDFGGILWGKGKNGSIHMNGHALNIDTGVGNVRTQSGERRGDESTGILVNGGTLELKSLGKTTIQAHNNGIHLVGDQRKGNANLYIKNQADADHAVKIMSKDKGIYLESYNGAARLEIDGMVDIDAPKGVVVDGGTLTIGGGRIVSKGDAALYVNSPGTAKINAAMDGDGNVVPMHENRDVQIEGDIQVKAGSASAYIGLTTRNSVLKGLFTTDMYTWPQNNWELASGNGYLVLKNGGTWEHAKVGTGMDKNGALELGDSRVNRLNADGGVIRQNDKRSILIDDFRGKMKVIYEHENDGSKATDYTAGDIKITTAQQGSDVTMMTDSKNITLTDDAQVRSVLDALAGKLYYEGALSGRTNLKGTAMIAEGLTASSVSKKTVDIFFRSSDGKGYTRDTVENGIYKNFHGLDTSIDRSNKESLTFDNFSGSARFFYKHVNDGTQTEDYGSDPEHKDPGKFYGDTHIKHAAANSSVMMITDRQGIDTSDETAVRRTLNALAGKLYYDGYVQGERNLTGKAMIAEGLTGSAISQELDLDYWLSDGRAYVKSKDTAPLTVETIEKQIAEGNFDTNDTKAYWKGKDIYDGKGNYTFHRDIKLVTKAADNPVISAKDNKFGTIYWNGDVQGSIDMTGHRLDVKAGPGGHGLLPGQGPNAGWERTPNAITVYSGTLAIKNVKGMDIESDPKGSLYGRGIFVMGYPGGAGHMSGHGKAKFVIENDDNPAHAIKIRVKDTGEDFGAIEARKNMGSAEVDIKGLVDIDSKMWRAVESHGARVSIGGGVIKGSDVASIAAYDYGTVFVNAKLDDGRVVATSATRPVQITGDISSEGGGHIVLGLNNKDSFFKGLASTDINGIDKQTQKWIYNPGNVSLLLANGATWEHKQVGTGYHHKKETGSNEQGIAMDSRVTRLQADKGVLNQYDPHKLTIDNYAGSMKLIYQHEGDGTKTEHYKAGDVHIKKAAENSSVTMVTDSNGLTLTDETQVYKTLNALAGKLYYDGYKTGERNLRGEAMISEGLVSSSKTLKKANMDWSESSGQGSVKAPQPQLKPEPQPQPKPEPQPQPKPEPQPKPQPKIEYGDYETKLMSGVKSAMTASTMAWRAEANDLMKRMGDLRLSPEDEGVWARVYRGKSSSNKDKTNFEMNYTTIQVGYDKTVSKDWRVGIAGSYMKGSSSYASGSGKNKEGNLGVYGTWTGKNGEYVDLIAKVGRLSNEYTVYNDFGHYVKGDFRTWGGSLSAEYGRRINMKGGSFVEPQIEMIYTHLNGADYRGETDYVGRSLHVRQSAMDSFIGRLGIGIGQETERSTWFLKASLYHEFAGGLLTEYSDGFTPKSTTQRGKDTWVGIQLGATTKLNDRTSLYGTFEKTFGGDVKTDWRVDAGFRWSF